MKKLMVMLSLLACVSVSLAQSTTTPASGAKDEGVSFKLRGALFLNLENWDKLGEGSTPELERFMQNNQSAFALGLMGNITAGVSIDEMYLGVGPHLGMNMWSFSLSSGGYSASGTINVQDFGADVFFETGDNIYILFGIGKSDVSVSATAGNESDTIKLPDPASYNRVGLGWSDGLAFGISYVSYKDWAKNLGRLEVNIGYIF